MSSETTNKKDPHAGLLTLFVRKEPTTDTVSIELSAKNCFDTVAYQDVECTIAKGRWPWYQAQCPRQGQVTAMLNCYRWKLEWLPKLESRDDPASSPHP